MILQYHLQGVFVIHGQFILSVVVVCTPKEYNKFSMGKIEEILSATWVVFRTHLL
jgi:hypothetical protein